MSDFIVVGDCGGTNTRLALWEIPQSANEVCVTSVRVDRQGARQSPLELTRARIQTLSLRNDHLERSMVESV